MSKNVVLLWSQQHWEKEDIDPNDVTVGKNKNSNIILHLHLYYFSKNMKIWINHLKWLQSIQTISTSPTRQCWNKYLFWDESNIKYYSSDENWTNRISNIICSSRKYSNIIRIPENIRIFEYIQINLPKNVKFLEYKIFQYPKNTF